MTAVHAQWYFMRGAEEAGPFDEAYARQLAEAGHVLATDKARRGHFQAWEEAGDQGELFPPATAAPGIDKYRSLERQALALRTLLYVGIALAAAGIWANLLQHSLWSSPLGGRLAADWLPQSLTMNFERQVVIGALRGFAQLATAVLFFLFVYRAAKNCRALGARDMQISPQGAVLWYFVPLAHLFKPCHALIEIAAASRNPDHWQTQEEQDALLPAWWMFYVGVWFLGLYAASKYRNATGAEELMALTPLLISANLVYIAWLATAIVLVQRIARYQEASRRRFL